MTHKVRKQTPEKIKPLASANERNANVPQKGLAGDNPRGEVAGCPTGLANNPQAQQPQQAGGGGAPGTGELYSPGEEAVEEKTNRSKAKN